MNNSDKTATEVAIENHMIMRGLPTPEDMVGLLGDAFSTAQAEAIAAEIYQPLRDMFIHVMMNERS